MFESDYDPNELQGTGRHLSKTELFAWTRLLDASRLIEEFLAKHVTQEHGMTHSDYEVLVRLDGASGSMRMTALASDVVSSPQKLYHTVNRLEERGWLHRESAPEDGRGSVATLTAEGSAVLAEAAVGHAQLIRSLLLEQLSDDELKMLGEMMQRVASHARIHRNAEHCEQCFAPEAQQE